MIENLDKLIPSDVWKDVNALKLDVRPELAYAPVNELLQSTVLLGGKRLRPMLTLLVGRFLEIEHSDLVEYAKLIELVHAASLSHDDVIDNATLRRDAPSINAVSGNKLAVLAGDYLLAHVIDRLARLGRVGPLSEMSWVIKELATGEWVQWEAAIKRNYSEEVIREIALKKTSSVMIWSCVVGTYFDKSFEIAREKLREFGRDLGEAFQLIDDTLDFSKESQKDDGLDVANNQLTAVTLEWFKSHKDEYQKYLAGENLAVLLEGRDFSEASGIVRDKAYRLLEGCRSKLDFVANCGISTNKEAQDALYEILALVALRNS